MGLPELEFVCPLCCQCILKSFLDCLRTWLQLFLCCHLFFLWDFCEVTFRDVEVLHSLTWTLHKHPFVDDVLWHQQSLLSNTMNIILVISSFGVWKSIIKLKDGNHCSRNVDSNYFWACPSRNRQREIQAIALLLLSLVCLFMHIYLP